MSVVVATNVVHIVMAVTGMGMCELDIEAPDFDTVLGWIEDKNHIDGINPKVGKKGRFYKSSIAAVMERPVVGMVAAQILRPVNGQ